MFVNASIFSLYFPPTKHWAEFIKPTTDLHETNPKLILFQWICASLSVYIILYSLWINFYRSFCYQFSAFLSNPEVPKKWDPSRYLDLRIVQIGPIMFLFDKPSLVSYKLRDIIYRARGRVGWAGWNVKILSKYPEFKPQSWWTRKYLGYT